MPSFKLYFRIWAVACLIWMLLCTFFYFQSGIPAADEAPRRWEKEFMPVYGRLKQLYSADRANNPNPAKLTKDELARTTDARILEKLQRVSMLTAWCEIYKVINLELQNFQPAEKAEYLLFRNQINPAIFTYNFVPVAQCPGTEGAVPDGQDPNRFIASFKPSGARDLKELLSNWKQKQRQEKMRVVYTSVGIPVLLFILMLGLFWIQQAAVSTPRKYPPLYPKEKDK